MGGVEALESVQYVTVNGKRYAVLSASDWEAMLEWLETVEDVRLARAAFEQLKACGGDRARAGWLRWDEVREQIG
jgi:hypothetical protein